MSELTEFRGSKDEFFKSGDASPLAEAQRRGFQGLDYFAENAALRFEIKPEILQTIELVEIGQSGGGEATDYIRWAKIRFPVGSEEAELTVFKDEETGAVFLPFVDATGREGETYGGGRYPRGRRAGGRPPALRLQLRLQPLLRLQRALDLPHDAVREPPLGARRGGRARLPRRSVIR